MSVRDWARRARRKRRAAARSMGIVRHRPLGLETLESRLLLTSNPLITEIVASNKTGLSDMFGEKSDWIEIYNPDRTDAVDLTGWKLRYKSGSSAVDWSFPTMTLGPGEYRVIFASGRNLIDPTTELHTNFSLNKDGERLRLIHGTSVIQDFDDYPELEADISYGVGQEVTETKVLDAGAITTYYVPSNDSAGDAWTETGYDDSTWTQGTTGVGFSNQTPGFAVWGYKASSVSTISTISTAQAVIASTANQSWSATETTPSINYYITGSRGHFIYDTALPNMRIGVAQDNYVFKALGTIHVPTAGTWTFGVNSDDGFRLSVSDSSTGAAVAFSNVYVTGTLYNGSLQYEGIRTANDTLGTITFSEAGDYDLDLIYYQGNSSAAIELYAAWGAYTTWASTSAWRLIGDTANGGLEVDSPPFTGSDNTIVNLVSTNVREALAAATQHTTVYTRTEFDCADWESLASLTLKLAYDDGYVAYINGVEVARSNAPASVNWNSQATADRTSEVQSTTFETIDISYLLDAENPNHITATGNVLAIQVLRSSATDGDLLLLPEISTIVSTQLDNHFFRTPTPGAANTQESWQTADNAEFSSEHGFYDSSFTLTLTTDTDGSYIYYTTDNSSPWDADTPTLLSSAITRSGATATVTLANHGYANGDVILVASSTVREYNGVFTISNVTTNTFCYPISSAAASASGGAPTVMKIDAVISSITRSGTVATVTLPNHGFVTGNLVRVMGADQSEYNGDFIVTVVDANTFTYTVAATAASPATGGLGLNKLGELYTAGIPITTTTTVRTRVYNAAYEPSDVVTETYIFLNDVINQPADPEGFPANWNTVSGDYEMDPEITQNAAYATLLRDALLALPTVSIVGDVDALFDANIGILASTASLTSSNAASPPATGVSVEYFDPNGDEEGFSVTAGVQVYGNAGRGAAYKKHGMRIVFKDEYGDTKLRYALFGEDAADEFDTFILRCSYGDMWTVGGSTSQYIRNAYGCMTQLALGDASSHSKFVHVYIDGLYWGIFEMVERPDASFAASYYGGDKDDYESHNSGYDNLSPKITNIPNWNALLADTKVGFATTGVQAGVAGFNATMYVAGASETPGFTAITYRANVSVTSLTVAEAVIINGTQQSSTSTATAGVVNYLNTSTDGHFTDNNTFPGMSTTEVSNFVVEITSSITIPTTGAWTFGVSSNDGFRLTLTNGVETYTSSYSSTRTSPGDQLNTFTIATAGSYRLRLVYFQYTGGAELELYAAQGSYSSWAATTAWRLVGDTANGGLASYLVTSVTSLAAAEALITNPARQAWTKTQTPSTINYLTTSTNTNTAMDGRFGSNIVFPGTTSGTVLQSFVMLIENTISIPSTGKWTFAVNSDDGFHLTLMDGTTTILDSYYDGTRSASDTLKTVNINKAGSYSLRLVYYQSTTPGASLELYAAKGEYSTYSSASTWQLLGSNVIYTSTTMTKAGILSLAAPITLSSLTEAENVLTPVYQNVSAVATDSSAAVITRSGTTATVTVAGHGYVEGQAVLISGAEQPQYNGTFTIFNVTADTFDVTVSSSAVSPATGTILVQPYGITRNRSTAIVWLPDHGYSVGDYVKVTGCSQGDYNGTFQITSVTDNTFSYGLAGVPTSPATGSAITVSAACQAWTYTTTVTTVNFIATGSDGHFASSVVFPGEVSGNLVENYALQAKTTISIPTAGAWTFGVSSDEGFSLTLTNGTDTYYAEYNGTRTAGDTFTTFEVTTTGMYNLRLVYFQKSSAAEVELYAAAGAYTAWSDTSAWKLVGDLGGLGTSLSNLAYITTYEATGAVTSLDLADTVISNTTLQASVTSEYRSIINFTTNTDDEGHYGGSTTFPGVSDASDGEDFVVHVQATITIPTAGAWTFAVSCDDGFRLTIYDGTTAMSPVMERDGTGAFEDSVEVYNFQHTGSYNLELVYYQHTGDAGLELSAAVLATPKSISGVGAAVTIPNASVRSITRSDATATVTLASHGFAEGDSIVIRGADQSAYNGAFTITNVTADSFTYTVSGTPVSPATGSITAGRLTTITRSGTTATATCSNHGFATGDMVFITGANESEFNGTFSVTVVNASTFTYTVVSTAAAAATGTISASTAAISRSGSTATVTLHNHGFSASQIVLISGADQSAYNGYVKVVAVTSNTFTYAVNGTPVSPATGTLAVQTCTINSTSSTNLASSPRTVGSNGTALVVCATRSVSSITRSGTTATVTSAAHGFLVGDTITISGASPTGYNGTFTLLSVATNTFTYTVSSSLTTPATGTITATKSGTITRVGTTATVTLPNHGYVNGQAVIISGADQSAYNGTFAITYVDSSTFRYTISSDTAASPATGTITAQATSLATKATVTSLKTVSSNGTASTATSLVRSGTTVTVTRSNHGFVNGQTVIVSGATPSEYNGTFTITYLSSDTFSYQIASATVASPAAGTITLQNTNLAAKSTVTTLLTLSSTGTPSTVTSLTRSGTTVTVTKANHGFVDGQMVYINGAAQSDYNGYFAITYLTADMFSYEIASATATSPATGTIYARTSSLSNRVSTTSGITRSGTTATVTLSSHYFMVGQTVVISGAGQSEYNGVHVITAVTSSTFSFTVAATATSPATGTISAQAYGICSYGTTAIAYYSSHGYAVGDPVLISGANEAAYNGVFTITAVTAYSFSYTLPSEVSSPATGTVRAQLARVTRNGATVTVTLPNHGYVEGQTIVMTGSSLNDYNGVFTISNVSTSTFDYTLSTTPASPATGTISAQPYGICTSGTTAIVALASHGYSTGDTVLISGAADDAYNGIHVITVLTSRTFTYSLTTLPTGPATGTVTAQLPQVVRSGSTVTVTLANHGYLEGQTILISGATQPEYNGTFTIVNVKTNSFGYTISGTPDSPATGTIYAQPYGICANGTTAIVSYNSHGYSVGDLILISGASDSAYNGTFTITSKTTNSFAITLASTPSSSPATGTIVMTKGGVVRSGSTATVTLMNHGLLEGQTVLITGATQPEYNGSFEVFDVTANTFSYTVTGTPVSPATGTIYVQQPYGITRIGSTALVSLASHGFAVGDKIRIEDADQAEYNGTFTVTNASLNAFTYELSGTPASPATGATIKATSLTFSLSNFRLVGDTSNGGLAAASSVSIDDMYYYLQGLNPDGTRNENYTVLVDMDNYIDYMITCFYVGITDWPTHNFYAAMLSTEEGTGYKFFSWDTDSSLVLTTNMTKAYLMVAQPYYYLCASSEFRMRFADRAQAYLYHGGPLTAEASAARYQVLVDELWVAMIAESARWGDIPTSPGPLPHTVDQWRSAVSTVLTSYFPYRTNVVIDQFKAIGLLPSVDAPTFYVNGQEAYGGTFAVGDTLTITAASGATIYYCVDGSDPRLAGGAISPSAVAYTGAIRLDETVLYKCRAYLDGTWSALADVTFYPDLAPALRITELMYHPADPSDAEIAAGFTDADDFEYIEITNVGDEAVPLSGLYLSNGVDYTFPTYTLQPGARVVVASNPDAFAFRYPSQIQFLVDETSGYAGHLANDGEKIELSSPIGSVIQEFSYKDGWYDQTDSEGFSLTVRDAAQDTDLWDDADGWRSSAAPGGSPGYSDTLELPGAVIVNEVLAHTDLPQVDAIEFYNTTDEAIDVSGWFVSDVSANLMKYQIAAGTIIAAHGYLVLTADNFNNSSDPGCLETFALSEYGEDVYLSSSAGGLVGGYREHASFTAMPVGVSQGLYTKSDGGTDFTLLEQVTLGAANDTIPYISDLVINRIMYNPTAATAEEIAAGYGSDDFEYLELYNRSETTVTLANYYLGNGVGFTFGWYADGTEGEVWTLEAGATATWTPTSLTAGTYTVQVHYTRRSGDGTTRKLDDQAEYTINTTSGPVIVPVDQDQENISGDDIWVTLGTFDLDSTAWIKLTRGDTDAGDWTIAEAVRLTPSGGGSDVVLDDPVLDSYALRTGLTTLGPGQYLVLVSNCAAFDFRYDIGENGIPVVGVYSGNLANDGEKVALYQLGIADPGIVPAYRVDYVNYDDGDEWPSRPDGDGPALYRVHPAIYGNEPSNWQASAVGIRPGQAAVRLDKSPPSIPVGLSAVSAVTPENQITLTWNASSDNQSYVDYYLVYRGSDLPVTVYTTTYVDTAVLATTPYRYRVSAVNRDGYESDLCDAVTVSIPGIESYSTPDSTVKIVFSEPLDAATASVLTNYSINGATPTGVTLSANNTTVTLATDVFDDTTLVGAGAAARMWVPTNSLLGTAWTGTSYDDSAWAAVTTGIGFYPSLESESEPNDTVATADAADRNFTDYSSNFLFLGLRGTADATGTGDDWFKIGAMQAGDVLTISATGADSSRATSPNVYIELWRYGSSSALIIDDDSGTGLDALIARYTVTTADTYYVRVKRSTTAVTAGTYALNLWLENSGTTPTTDGTLTDETEANDYLSTANDASSSWRLVQYRSTTAGTISSSSDVDYYSYYFTAGDLVTFNVASTSSLDAKVSLYYGSSTLVGLEDGTSVFASPYNLNAPLYCYIVPTTGTYYLKVASSGTTTGSYTADVYLASDTRPTIFDGLVATDVETGLYGVNTTAYLRMAFDVADAAAFSTLRLRIKYDDGFVAYLNGTEIARRNAPSSLAWNSSATASRGDAECTLYEEIDITAFLSALHTGTNVLSFQVLSLSASDTDLLLLPELIGSQVGADCTVTINNLATASGNEISSPVQLSFTYEPQGSGYVTRQYWTSIAGSTVASLTTNTKYPTTPTGTTYLSALEIDYNWTDNYGTRIRGYVYPPQTGSYTFWIAGDDTCELWLSTDDNPANKRKIAFVASIGSNTHRNWTNYTSQVSAAISLAAGQRYYIEIVHKDYSGTDNCSVRWQLPDGSWESGDINAPIPGIRLSPYGTMPVTATPSTPTNLAATVTDNGASVTLSWSASADPDYVLDHYVIYRDGVSYGTSTTTSFVDTDVSPSVRHRYQVAAANVSGFESTVSRALNMAPLGIASIGAFTLNTVQITFSEAVDPTTATDLANFAIEGVTVSSATLSADRLMVTLTTSTLTVNTPYTVTINGVYSGGGALVCDNLQQSFQVGGAVLREYWLNIGTGTAVIDLTSAANYPNNPTGVEYRTTAFESQTNWTTAYGERDRAYLIAPTSGYYTFWIASDDTSELYLSTVSGHTTDPGYKTLIASVSSATGARAWTANQTTQRSASIYLEAGQSYYVEALMKQGSGSSHLAVAWLRPDSATLPAIYPALSLTSLTRSGSTVTATMANHGFTVGQSILISGASQSAYNGTYTITSVTTDTFTYTISSTPTSPATGTLQAAPYGISRSGSTAIVWYPNHGFAVGDCVAIGGADQSNYNSAFVITSVTANTFRFTVSSSTVTPATGAMYLDELEPIPAAYLMPYALISSTGSLYTATVDDQGTTDTTPTLDGTVSDSGVSVTVCVDGVYYAAINNGNSTWELPGGAIQTPLADGSYSIAVCLADSLGRVGFDTTSNELIVDTVLPTATITGYGTSLRHTSVSEVQIVFSEAVTGFGLSDLRFSRAGGSDLIDGRQTLITTDHITWTLSGLPTQTLIDVPYTLTLLGTGSNIEDAGDNELAADVSATWSLHFTPPTVAIDDVVPNHRGTPVTTLSIVFDEWVDGLDLADLRLTRDGGGNLLTGSETLATEDHITWTLGGISSLTTLSGSYTFSLLAADSGIADEAGNLLVMNAATSWTVDSVAPIAVIAAVLPNPRNASVSQLLITFSEAVQGLTLANLSLTRGGGSNLLTTSQTLTTTDSITWTLNNLDAITAAEGNYCLSLSSSGVTDSAGNALAQVTPRTWIVDTTAPTATITPVTPSPRDTVVSTMTITFSEVVQGFSLSSLALTCNGGANLLTAAQTLDTTDNRVWTLGNLDGLTAIQGNYTLTLSPAGIADTAGNALASSASTTWSMVISDLDADGNGTADALTDGILILRYLFDPHGSWNYADALGSGATRTTRTAIREYLDNGLTLALDADGNGTADALTDGILILRYLFDPAGSWNYADALGSGATRNTRAAIREYLNQYNPAYAGGISSNVSLSALDAVLSNWDEDGDEDSETQNL
jgi:hypothetical protein